MDRTSILGDTIDYVRELLERIKSLQEEIKVGQDQPNLLDTFNGVNPNEMLSRISPKVTLVCNIVHKPLAEPNLIHESLCSSMPRGGKGTPRYRFPVLRSRGCCFLLCILLRLWG